MILKPWMPAVESQLEAFRLADWLVKHDKRTELKSGWSVDKVLLQHATPYMWSAETVAAVLEASKTIPLDTEMNRWNLQTELSWWYFESPLPFETLSIRRTSGVRALAFGVLPTKDFKPGTYPAGTPVSHVFGFGMPTICWIDDPSVEPSPIISRLSPSQVFEWDDGQTLQGLLDITRKSHQKLYGPRGKWEHKPQIGLQQYMDTTEGVARFLLAGIAWLNQKVAVTTDGPVERHRRKEITRVMKRDASIIRVVSLRKAERTAHATDDEPGEHREYHVRWVVSGHWRNQPCGPKSGDRRLTFITPYMKGPDDKPLKATATKVYTVDR